MTVVEAWPVPEGQRRVFARLNVGPLRHGRWMDVPDDDRLAELVAAGYASFVDYRGNGPPARPDGPGCCGAA